MRFPDPCRRRISRILALALCLSLLTVSVSAADRTVYESRWQLADNLIYTDTVRQGSNRLALRTLTLSPGGEAEAIVSSCDTIYGGMTVDNAVAYAESQGHNVLAAVNADFFGSGHVSTGIVVQEGEYLSSPEWNSAVYVDETGRLSFSAQPVVRVTLTDEAAGRAVSLTHVNKLRTADGLYLYSSAWSTVSTRTTAPGWWVRLEILEGSLTLSGTMELQVTELHRGSEAATIGEGYLILTASDAAGLDTVRDSFAPGDRLTLSVSCSDEALAHARWATGGGDVLIRDGAVTDDAGWHNAAGANPRTAIGAMADGTVICLVADGRQSGYSAGLTLKALAREMLDRGCVWAVNLDGGGSSVMQVRLPGQGNTVVNSPSDGSARRCGTYLMLVTEAAGGGAPHLYLENNGALVYAGAELTLIPAAADGAYRRAAVPADMRISAGLGAVSGLTYTAGKTAGTDILTLSSGGGSGRAEITVTDTLTSLGCTRTGKSVTRLSLARGERVELGVSGSYYGLPVTMGAEDCTWTVTGEIGRMDEAGVFTAGKLSGTGRIILTAGGVTAAVEVEIPAVFTDMQGHPADEAAEALRLAGIVNGMAEGIYGPEEDIRRGDFLLMLYRAAGQPAVTGTCPFTDVDAGAYYAGAVIWAAARSIALGNGDGTFTPDAALTRQQAFAFVRRALPALGVTDAAGDTALVDACPDGTQVASWAREPTAVLLAMGAVDGSDLRPADALTRGEMALLLYALLA